MLKILKTMLLPSLVLISFLRANESQVKAKIQFQDNSVHIEFSGKKDWKYQVDKDKSKKSISILVDQLSEESKKILSEFKSQDIHKIKVETNKEDNKDLILITLKNDLESFDYLVDEPSRLVVDLYKEESNKDSKLQSQNKNENEKKVKAEQLIKSADVTNEISNRKNNKLKSESLNKANKSRKPATADFLKLNIEEGIAVELKNKAKNLAGIFDGADPFYERFSMKNYEFKEDTLVLSKENYYIPFPDIDLPIKDWEKIKKAENIFDILPKNTEENKHARLLHRLMENKRYQVFFKTYEWFKQKYPESEYNDLLNNMAINIHLTIWDEKKDTNHYDQATQKMREIVTKKPDHALSEKYSLLQGILAFEKKDYFNSLRNFQAHQKIDNWNKKGSFSADLAKLGVGLSYMNLNQFNEAYSELNDIETNSIYEDIKSEAAYRKGDIRLKEKKYDLAVKEYQESYKRRPKNELSFPNYLYNQAQALFHMEKYHESLNTYLEFIKKFPQDSSNPYAMTRVGEILEILGASKEKVLGSYMETYFRNGENPNAIVARLRLLTAKMKSMKPKEVEYTVKEISELVKKSDLKGMDQFSTVLIAEGYQSRHENDKALDLLVNYYKSNPTTVDRQLFSKRIVSNIYDKIEYKVVGGDFISALKIYTEYFDNWLKHSARIDIKYQIGRAYELGGVFEPSAKYYQEVLNKLYSIQNTNEGKERKVKEKLPPISLVNLRLANCEYQNKNFSKAFDYLKNIKDPALLSEQDQIERILLATHLYEKKGDIDSAILYLTELLKQWQGQAELVAEPYFKLSELEFKKGLNQQAIESLKKIDQLMEDTKLVPKDIYKKSLEKIAKYYDENKNYDLAITWYEKLLEKFENVYPIASIRYRLGKIYFDIGKIQKASEIWSQFKGDNSESWKKIAQEQIRSNEWKNENKKIIDRLPSSEKNN